jgi:hypothetical protein
MSNHSNLRFFNKEGDSLNFNYDSVNERFQGDILFAENSNDTYKTYAIYTLEKIDSFDFEDPPHLTTRRFQLFNELGLHFYNARYKSQKVLNIAPVNNDPQFYTKWIYGVDFDARFPIGTIIQFDSPILEFTNLTQTYPVVGSKPGAIMISSQMDNLTFELNYFQAYQAEDTFDQTYISGLNAVGVYDYIDPLIYKDNLSLWNEFEFYNKYYVGKKLNIVGSEKNDEQILTIVDDNLTDLVHWEYRASKTNLPTNTDLIIEIISKTDVPRVYQGSLNIVGNKIFIDDSDNYPQVLKPGVEFKIVGSNNNTNFYQVDSMLQYDQITFPLTFVTQSQVLWNNRVYECIKTYTLKFANFGTALIQPDNTEYWSLPTHIKVNQTLSNETISLGQIYLTTNKFYYTQSWTYSAETTLATAATKYKSDLEIFNIDLFYQISTLRADLMYPSQYAEVNFYHTSVGPTYSFGSKRQTFERLIEVRETLNYELNYNYSENKRINIVFTDIDEFGFKILINGMEYDEETAFLYSGGGVDMERTIDRTLRRWLSRWYLTLYKLGIEAELKYTGSIPSVFYNSVVIKSHYPNVPLILNEVKVGTTANFYIEHSRVLFHDMGPYLNITVNDTDYGQTALFLSGNTPNIPATLQAWHTTHVDFLNERGIRVEVVNNLIKFSLLNSVTRLDYKITTGKINLPGISDYTINRKFLGNAGVLIASNEVILATASTESFEDSGFATGMAFTINNTAYPYVNVDYSVQYLEPNVMNLSYQGPFWELDTPSCNLSGFMTLAFSLGFGQTACQIPVGPPGGTAGEFNPLEFDPTMFNIQFNPNTYTINTYNLAGFTGTSNLVDLIYVELVGSIYGFGDDVIVLDALNGSYIASIPLSGNTQSIEMELNPVNSYLYCLSQDWMWIVDPTSNSLVSGFTFSFQAYQIEINPVNGDVYVSYKNSSHIDIWYQNNISSSSNTSITLASGNHRAMVFNDFEKDMYVTGTNEVNRIDGTMRSLQVTYGITGVTNSIFYEPVNESIFVYTSSGLYKIDNGITQSLPSITNPGQNDIIFNNLTGQMNISNSALNFLMLDLGANTATGTSIGNWGYMVVNQFDGDVYLSSQLLNSILVMNAENGMVKYNYSLSAQTGKIIYNPERKSVWTIQPSQNTFVEISVDLNVILTPIVTTFSYVEENLYGTLDPSYIPRPDMWIKTREYYRRPRENFNGDTPVEYYWKLATDQTPEFFIYDFSGTQLSQTGSYAYTGPKPLPNPVLNSSPNKDVTKVSIPQYQQTIFDKVQWQLSYIDDETDISTEAESLELFLGFKAANEGAIRSVLQFYKKEDIEFTITSDSLTNLNFETILTSSDKYGEIKINETSSEIFTDKGLKPGQHLIIYVKDDTNVKKQYISDNNGLIVIIRQVYTKTLVVDFFNVQFDFLATENGVISNYPEVGKTTYLKTTFKVRDREIGRFTVYGQTEEEDERFKIELGNVGKLIKPDEVFIFKEYDINEGGTDWMFLNKKRKEMLMNKHEIYTYIGAYKSLINAINYFGYNDLQLNEYYLDLDTTSVNFNKLFKVEVPDIFDNTIRGWNEKDFVKKNLPSDTYEATNLFNLTYFITNKEGDNVLSYSIDEIIIKLQGLKYWLKRNIIPLTHKILDITGTAYFNGGTQITHNLYDARLFNIRSNMTPISFKMNELYLMPVNSGSTVYNCVLDFYTIIEGRGSEPNPPELGQIKPYYQYANDLVLPDTYDIKIRTYKTYKEWAPYVTYEKNDKVIYFEKIYESVINGNKLNNPRKYENVESWQINAGYEVSTIVSWKREFYSYSGLGGTASTLTPEFDPINWLRITEWKEIDLEPVQYITEHRTGENLVTFNFTLDSNIDPYVVIEVNSHNGYGQCWGDRKNYYIRGLKDLQETYRYIDPIGPFVPIQQIV